MRIFRESVFFYLTSEKEAQIKRIICTAIFVILLPLSGCVLVSPKTLDFGSDETNKTFKLTIVGDDEWSINYSKSWLTVEPDNGQGTATINVTVDRTGLYRGDYEARLNVFSGGEVVGFATVLMDVSNSPENGEWQIETVDNVAGYLSIHAASLMLDSNDKGHISYLIEPTYENYNLKYATNASGNWELVTIDSSDGFGVNPNTSIALDSNDRVHISYVFARGYYDWNDLKYATNASDEWVIETLDSVEPIIDSPSLALDSDNKAHISYIGPSNVSEDIDYGLYYATNASNSWVIEKLDYWWGGSGRITSLALDSNDRVHIIFNHDVYLDPHTSTTLTKYATNSSGSWVIEELNTLWGGISLALDSNDKAHISNVPGCPPLGECYSNIYYITNASGNWVTEMVDSGSYFRDSSLALDSSGNVHIGYSAGGRVHIAINASGNSGNWVAVPLEGGSPPALTLDSNDNVHISYYGYLRDSDTTILRYTQHK